MKAEIDLQSEIREGWEAGDPTHWGRKLTHAYTSGIPDLFLSGSGGPWIVEIKKCSRLPANDDTRISFDHHLTALQEQCLKSLRKGGTYAAWMVVHRTFHEDGIFIGYTRDDIPTLREFIAGCHIRKRGQPWMRVFPGLLTAIKGDLP